MGNSLEFAGKVVLITGGNSGIGAATARCVAELSAQVVVTGRRQSEWRRLVNDIKRNRGSAAFIEADLRQPEQVKRIVPFTLKTFGRLDYAFNNAGISGENRLLSDQTEKTFDRVFAVNVKALFLLLQDKVRQMMAQGQGGSIVNTASVGGLLSFPTAGPTRSKPAHLIQLPDLPSLMYSACRLLLLNPMQLAQVEQRLRVAGLELQNLPIKCQSVLVLPPLLKHHAQIEVGCGIVGVDCNSLLVHGNGLIEPTFFDVQAFQINIGSAVMRQECHHAFVLCLGVCPVARCLKSGSIVQDCVRIVASTRQ